MKRSSEDGREALLPRDIIVEGSDRRGRLSSDTGGLRTSYGSGKGGGAAGGINDGDEGSEDSGDVDTKALDDGGVPSAVQRMSLASVMFIMCGFIVVTVVNNIYRKKVWFGVAACGALVATVSALSQCQCVLCLWRLTSLCPDV